MKTITYFILISIVIALSSCKIFYANQYPSGITSNVQLNSEKSCDVTKLTAIFKTDSLGQVSNDELNIWRSRVTESIQEANNILRSTAFGEQCQILRMKRTNNKSVQEVCRNIICSGHDSLNIGFYSDSNTKAIAYETNGKLFINIAKKNSGAGSSGNLVHEFTHTLGYTHFTNWAPLGKNSVPYKVGNLIDKLSTEGNINTR